LTRCSLVCITEAYFRDTCGSDLVGAKVVRHAGETALGSPRLDAKAFLKPASHYFRDAESGTPPRVNGRDSRERLAQVSATPATDTAYSQIVHRLQR
jgi:hypothetical protein